MSKQTLSLDNRIHCMDALKGLRKLPDNSVHCIVTSPPYWGLRDKGQKIHSMQMHRMETGQDPYTNGEGKANKRSVWTVATAPFKEAHFATFPQELITDCIKAGCPEGGVVLDPFMGAGTTALVAAKLNRKYVGFELNPEYVQIAEKRLQNELGLFNPNTQ